MATRSIIQNIIDAMHSQVCMTLIRGVYETKSEPIMAAVAHVRTDISSSAHPNANPM